MHKSQYSYLIGMPKLQQEIALLELMIDDISHQNQNSFVESIAGTYYYSAGAAKRVYYAVWGIGWVRVTKRTEDLDREWGDKLNSDTSVIGELLEEDCHELLSWMIRGEKWGAPIGIHAQKGNLDRLLKRLLQIKRQRADAVDGSMDWEIKHMALRDDLVRTALMWQQSYGVAPSITSSISEFDAVRLDGMSLNEYSSYMEDKTAVRMGYDFMFNGIRYQVKANRPSGKRGSAVTIVAKVNNYEWDQLIWINYDTNYIPKEAWIWHVDSYKKTFEQVKRLSPNDYRKGIKLDISILT
jgi:hypothetical protein